MGFLWSMLIPILGSKKIKTSDILLDIIYIISTESGYQILVTEICNGGRISDI